MAKYQRNNVLTAERLRELFHYDPDTGIFTRIKKSSQHSKLGMVSGYVQSNPRRQGYLVIGIDNKTYSCHRLAWLYVHGDWPEKNIDHINGNRGDNRISNLRDVPQSVNVKNVRKPRTDGVLIGARKSPNGKWRAGLTTDGKHSHLGTFDTMEEAHMAYVSAKLKYHGVDIPLAARREG